MLLIPCVGRCQLSRWVRVSRRRRLSTCTDYSAPHVCIVGSGPAGFYTAQQLLKGHPSLRVDIFERLPVPFGLVRYGVAPDHPEVKNVINTFTQTSKNERCSFFGNVTVGRDISVQELKMHYTAVVLSYGADDDRKLGIPGEDHPHVLSARNFVGWYNGLPEDANLNVNLDTDTAVVLGHGNVALDVARILLTPVDLLAKTDITERSLEVLRGSRVRRVVLVGRRGPLQVAFTIKELREMTKLPGTRPLLHPADYDGLQKVLDDIPRPRKRLTELLHKTALSPSEDDTRLWKTAEREWELRFRLSPIEVLTRAHKITGVKLTVNNLEGADIFNQRAVMTSETETIECGLVLRSIGYKGRPIDPAVLFDTRAGIIPNREGRVTGETCLYCSGWIGRGPVGVINNTMSDGFEVGKTVLKDIQCGLLTIRSQRHVVIDLLKNRGIQVVEIKDWEKIDKFEIQSGERIGKPREKETSVENMLRIAAQ